MEASGKNSDGCDAASVEVVIEHSPCRYCEFLGNPEVTREVNVRQELNKSTKVDVTVGLDHHMQSNRSRRPKAASAELGGLQSRALRERKNKDNSLHPIVNGHNERPTKPSSMADPARQEDKQAILLQSIRQHQHIYRAR